MRFWGSAWETASGFLRGWGPSLRRRASCPTAPGIRICAKALWNDTAKLPEIEIKKPESILGKDTITSMQAGIVYGYIGQTEYIIDNMKKESGLLNAKVIATGGLGRIIYENTDRIDIYDKELTLQGMRLIYEKNKK